MTKPEAEKLILAIKLIAEAAISDHEYAYEFGNSGPRARHHMIMAESVAMELLVSTPITHEPATPDR